MKQSDRHSHHYVEPYNDFSFQHLKKRVNCNLLSCILMFHIITMKTVNRYHQLLTTTLQDWVKIIQLLSFSIVGTFPVNTLSCKVSPISRMIIGRKTPFCLLLLSLQSGYFTNIFLQKEEQTMLCSSKTHPSIQGRRVFPYQ